MASISARDRVIIAVEPVGIGGDAGGDAAQRRREIGLADGAAVAADLDLVAGAERLAVDQPAGRKRRTRPSRSA